MVSGIDIAPNPCVDFVKPFKCKVPWLIQLLTKALNHQKMHFCYKNKEFIYTCECGTINKTEGKKENSEAGQVMKHREVCFEA